MKEITSSAQQMIDERRRLPDRRRRPTPMVAAFISPGRRRAFRRQGEGIDAYVDRPSRRAIAWAMTIMLLSACDAFLTIDHIRAGGRELIPTMAYALTQGEMAFTLAKMILTGAGVLVLALHERFRIARIGFRLLLGIYSLLMSYHLVLLFLR